MIECIILSMNGNKKYTIFFFQYKPKNWISENKNLLYWKLVSILLICSINSLININSFIQFNILHEGIPLKVYHID